MPDLGKQGPVPFDPRDPAWRGKLWVRLTLPHGETRLHVFYRRILVILLALALAGWLLGAVGLRVQAARLGIEGARFHDLFFPWRWDHYRDAVALHHWRVGREAFEAGELRRCFPPLVAAVRRLPAHHEARRLLAIAYLRVGHLRFAAACLEDGLAHGGATDLDQLKLLFGALDEMQADRRALDLALAHLPASATANLPDLYLALQAATVHHHGGRYDQAENLLIRWGLDRSVEGAVLLARIDSARGDPDAALARLDEAGELFPGRDELPLERLRVLREQGHADAWRREALLRSISLPDGPGPRVDFLAALRYSRDPSLAAERERFFSDFAADPRALALLAWEAVDAAEPDLATRVRAHAAQAGFPANAFVLAEVHACLAADQGARALALADAGRELESEDNPNYLPALSALRGLACYSLDEPMRGELEINVFVHHDGIRAIDGVALARELRRRGAPETARRALDAAVLRDPLNQAALTELVLLLAEQRRWAELEQRLPALLAMRKPSPAVLREVGLRLAETADDDAARARLSARLLAR